VKPRGPLSTVVDLTVAVMFVVSMTMYAVGQVRPGDTLVFGVAGFVAGSLYTQATGAFGQEPEPDPSYGDVAPGHRTE
jgi:hypothetical protein